MKIQRKQKRTKKKKKKGFVNLDFDERVECIGDNT